MSVVTLARDTHNFQSHQAPKNPLQQKYLRTKPRNTRATIAQNDWRKCHYGSCLYNSILSPNMETRMYSFEEQRHYNIECYSIIYFGSGARMSHPLEARGNFGVAKYFWRVTTRRSCHCHPTMEASNITLHSTILYCYPTVSGEDCIFATDGWRSFRTTPVRQCQFS